ncbi:hypothetical protein DY000_02035797 [Brassica cretica]|uniref:Uncharacterized protein n=1 Tax=Brassica cretica TaxID=69181 RepID=A0ABQ7DPY1_BRACR|nr:hypothetical protein DY000_02035797 [Brassica cretica]
MAASAKLRGENVIRESEYEASLVVFIVCLLSGFGNGVSGICSGCSSDLLVPRWLLVKQHKEVGVLSLPVKFSLEEGVLVSGAGLFSLWSFVQGVLVMAWYRERRVQVHLVLCCCVGHFFAYFFLCLVGSWQECRQF